MTLFRRRQPRTRRQSLREAVWPSMGLRRTFHYYRHRMFRTGNSTRKITAGLATGIGICWTPFVGTHVGQALLFCWLLGFNPIAGFIGTALGNPWTYPFIFLWAYRLGKWLCGWFGLAHFVRLPEGMAFDQFMAAPLDFLHYLFAHPQKLLLPLTVGGYACGLLCWPIAYALLFYPVRTARRAYRLQRLRFHRKRHEKELRKQA